MNIIQMSFHASILIVAIVIIRTIALHELPRKTFIALWGIATVRLLVPFSIPSRLSIYTGMDMLKGLFVQKTVIPNSNSVIALTTNVESVSSMEKFVTAGTRDTSVSTIHVIWLIGMCLCILFFMVTYIKSCKVFRMSLPVENEIVFDWLRDHPLHRPVQIRQNDQIKTPLTYGLFHPVILLPKRMDWMNESKLHYVLAHEYVHIKRFDVLTKMIFTIAVCVHWFNPFVWIMFLVANRDIELSCDESVVRSFGEKNKSAYALTLIGYEESKGHFSPLVNHFSKNAIEERIVSIMKIKKTSLMGIIMAMLLIIVATTSFMTSAANANSLAKRRKSTIEDIDRQMNKEATNSNESSTMMSYVNETDGKKYYSWDDGKTWKPMTDEEYNTMFPDSSIEWWTYDGYKSWLENEKVELQKMVGEKLYSDKEGWYVFTQEECDQMIELYESILADIKEGIMVSKLVNGDENTVISYNPEDIQMGTGNHEYSISIRLDNGVEEHFGPYATKDEMLAQVKPYCEEQVKAGYMSQKEADDILSRYK